MDIKEFKKALYYAVRECFNADILNDDSYIDERWDLLIRKAIAYFENTKEENLPPMCEVEIVSLAECSRRRLYPTQISLLVRR